MPAVITTGSPDIAVLDSQIIADLCAGQFYIDLTPSLYIGSGKTNVLGANVQIKNPHGVIVKPYGSNYEIAPALSGGMDGVINYAVPLLAGGYVTGQYIIDVQIFDSEGNSWTVSKPVSICAPDSKNKTKTFGSLSAKLIASCTKGKLYVILDSVPNYKGHIVQSQVNDLTLHYPTESGEESLETSNGSFSVTLYEGVYKLVGEICASYSLGDNVFAKVKYKIKKEKNVRCLLDECCVYERLVELNARLTSDCTEEERSKTTSIILDVLRLLKTAQLAADCGEDPSEYIAELENLLGCSCTCNCAEGAPVTNTTPVTDMRVEGCNVDQSQDGLTTVYIINNYEYVVSINENGGALVISAASTDGCVKTQQITFNIATVYSQIKTLANQNNTEADIWAGIVNKSLRDIDPSCLGMSAGAWQALSFPSKVNAIITKLCTCCGCSAELTEVNISNPGADVVLEWEESENVYSVDVYLDNVFQGNVLAGVKSFTFSGASDGGEHTYRLIPKCSNGSMGTPVQDTFLYLACPDIAPPSVTQSVFSDVTCPFDLTTSPSFAPPAGITWEYHNANNTDPSSLVPDPENVSSGIYYIFAKDADGCYSKIGTQVTVICDTDASCTAPQNLEVRKIAVNDIVMFQSAAYPPPGNSYTVKRRLASDPDVDGSYTTIGTPVWSAPFNRWVIADSTADDNVLYVYKAQSNCGDSPQTFPYATVEYADISCPSSNPTPDTNKIDYSFVPVGGEITKYEVKLYDATGTVLIEMDTHLPSFSNPTTGTFEYLTPDTTYKIVMVLYIGTYSKVCNAVVIDTLPES